MLTKRRKREQRVRWAIEFTRCVVDETTARLKEPTRNQLAYWAGYRAAIDDIERRMGMGVWP